MPRVKTSNKNNITPLQISRTISDDKNLSATDFLNSFLEEALEKRRFQRQTTEVEDPYALTGTLPDWAIKQYIKDGIIKIDPLPENWEELIDEVTIDFHLGNVLKVFRKDGLNTIDTRYSTREEIESMMETVFLKTGQPFILTENEFVIASTKERLTLPTDIIGQLNGKSSLARIGVVVHSTAARFDPGWDGAPVLEFGTFLKGKKIVIYEGSPICAFSFEKMSSHTKRSYMERPTSRYGGSAQPIVADEPGVRKVSKRG